MAPVCMHSGIQCFMIVCTLVDVRSWAGLNEDILQLEGVVNVC